MDTQHLRVSGLALPGVLRIQPTCFTDERGFFSEIYSEAVFKQIGIATPFVQDSVSFSRAEVIRGLHFQKPPFAQAKLVRVAHGEIFDVAADVDPNSSTYGSYISAILDGNKQTMLYIPEKYAHGFCALSDATVEYKLSKGQRAEAASGARYDDPRLSILWPVKNPVLSQKDQMWPTLPKTQESIFSHRISKYRAVCGLSSVTQSVLLEKGTR